jgi:sucrose phosphorylase
MTAIQGHLQFLYGAAAADGLYPQVLDLMRRHGWAGEIAQNTRPGLSLTQRDALLITYGDQVQEPGVVPFQTLASFLEMHLRGVVSGVHLLPFYPYSSDDGFAVKDFFAVSPALGTWADVAKTGESFDLMFDAVFNHLSAQSGWFERFLQGDPEYRDFFVTVQGEPDVSRVVRPRALPLLTEFQTRSGKQKVWTTFSADQVDLSFKNPKVLLAVLDALLFYAAKGARFIRLDAIAYLWKEIGTACIHLPQTHRIIQLMREVLDQVSPQVMLITETNVPHADNLSYFGDGTNEAQLVYNFALPPLVLHSLAGGDARLLTSWAASLRLPSDRVTFFNFLASHDGIGLNPVRGILSQSEIEALVARAQAHGGLVSYKLNADGSKGPYELNINYFDALSNPNDHTEQIETQVDRFMAAQSILLALAGVPGIYVHSLFGSRNDRAGAEASGMPRRINRQKPRRADLERDLANPASLRSRVFSRFKRLLKVRREQPVFHPGAGQRVLPADDRVFALLREARDGSQRLLCLHNVANESVRLSIRLPGAGLDGRWLDLLDQPYQCASVGGELQITLPPYQVFWGLEVGI